MRKSYNKQKIEIRDEVPMNSSFKYAAFDLTKYNNFSFYLSQESKYLTMYRTSAEVAFLKNINPYQLALPNEQMFVTRIKDFLYYVSKKYKDVPW